MQFYDCNGELHNTQAAANAVSCPAQYTACDGSLHDTQAAANAVDCSGSIHQQILHDLTCVGSYNQLTGQCDDLLLAP